MPKQNYIIIALGGSIIVPGKINVPFLKDFRKFIFEKIKKGKKFIIVTGGGKTARNFQKAASEIIKITADDLDWIGIHSTRLNAHLLRTIFRKKACPIVLDNPYKPLKTRRKIIVASGWRPGWSTDYIAVLLAKRFHQKEVIIASRIGYVYDNYNQLNGKLRKKVEKLSWSKYRKLIGSSWKPGMPSPVDPIAARLSQKLRLKAVIIKANKLKNLENLLEGKEFKGTVIE